MSHFIETVGAIKTTGSGAGSGIGCFLKGPIHPVNEKTIIKYNIDDLIIKDGNLDRS
jgi:hypothetical protein